MHFFDVTGREYSAKIMSFFCCDSGKFHYWGKKKKIVMHGEHFFPDLIAKFIFQLLRVKECEFILLGFAFGSAAKSI